MCFIDYKRAFDSIYHDAIWTALAQQNIDIKYINLIHSVYDKCRAKVLLERGSLEYPVRRGVRQGDPISPKLFPAVLETVFRSLEWNNKGVKIDGEFLSHLRFADDIVVFAKKAKHLETMINELSMASKRAGLSSNPSKSNILTNGENIDISVDGRTIECVEQYIYLGQLISFDNCTERDTQGRIALAWKKYWGLKVIMKNKDKIEH